MHTRFLTAAAAALFLLPFATGSVGAQQAQGGQPAQEGQGRGGSVQVGVPNGRGGQPAAPARGRGRGGPPPGPVPRTADGRVIIGGATPKDKGVWLPGGGGFDNPAATLAAIPFQPWARAVLDDRLKNQLEPHTRCKPSGGTRQFVTPYGVEIVDMPEIQRVFIFDIGGPHTYRTVYMDGRTHPADFLPTYYGHSVGWWEGDTLVIDSTGFNENFWIDRRGSPHTDKLHMLERFTRTDSLTLRYEYTVDDPGAYTAPWKGTMNLRWEPGTELFEYVCQQANYAHTLMLGVQETIDRTSVIVP